MLIEKFEITKQPPKFDTWRVRYDKPPNKIFI